MVLLSTAKDLNVHFQDFSEMKIIFLQSLVPNCLAIIWVTILFEDHVATNTALNNS